ncbi:RNA polymerase subunit sigma [Pedobacter sp. HMWF019]|uniref:sigma-70 family RNA polymerase sigma factor n=1 Tax=Pedobacter sp. HMWF019 TaxID=2056856 RepID=UPI000D36B826|nr:RNA polymerase sigma factor RpoD/SigA [Pedobacter sp. HMWF019]PTT03597.1 RNA polymerase subunit sigma [Pedobacter sp. HMWF019]
MRELKITQSITKRESESLDVYLNEIGRFELLTADEECILAKKVREGDQEALCKLIVSNLRFVVSVAKQYQHRGMALIDLINEGNLGLIKAAKRFDETKGFKFISFAVWWIRQNILQALGDQTRTVRLPLNQVSNITKLNNVIQRLEQQLERVPTAEELAEQSGIAKESVEDYLVNARLPISIDAIADSEIGSSLLDILRDYRYAPDKGMDVESLQGFIDRIMSVLSPRERYILTVNFGLGNTEPVQLQDIARTLGIGKERVRQLREIALRKLRANASIFRNKL